MQKEALTMMWRQREMLAGKYKLCPFFCQEPNCDFCKAYSARYMRVGCAFCFFSAEPRFAETDFNLALRGGCHYNSCARQNVYIQDIMNGGRI